MKTLQILREKLSLLTGLEEPPHDPGQGRSIGSRFAAPYTFSPDLSIGSALVAVAGCLTRLFGACALFAVWGGLSALAWSSIESHYWRAIVVPPLVLIFLAALAALMIAVSEVERAIIPKR